ncbi:ORP1 like protein [Zalerion maritima]|uniref:ORP1 like protein n=1 Tax=Zalerion maritima TaxID=339359 RepID=A0AAD5RQD6_9PEZI|nr:ORP1 like protein [Zalerion maritima]
MPKQENGDNMSNGDKRTNPSTPAEDIDLVVASDTPPFTEKDKKCLFMDNCDTGSTLRKAISHIFGRNKLCTRSIPEEVWVHYCRKHYQRSRYRNIKEWVVRCAELVAKQVQHIDDWSRWNAAHNKEAGVVTGWTINIRKREQKRLQEIGKKRSLPLDDDDEFDEVTDTADLTGTAVPPWIHHYMNKVLSTSEVQHVVSKLHRELQDETATTMPDIEILPEIDTTKTTRTRAAPRANNTRRAGAAHRRSQSMGQPLSYSNHHVEKRPRLGFQDTAMMPHSYSPYTMSPLGHQPRFSNFSPYGASQHAHVNSPAAQRPVGAASMPSHLENTNSFYGGGASYDGRRMSHQRSHSEVPFSYRPPPPAPQDFQLPSIASYHPADTTGSYYARTPQHDPSFRPQGHSLYSAPRESRSPYTQSPGYVGSYTNTASQPSYSYPQYPSSTGEGPSPTMAHSTSMSPPSSAIRPTMGQDMGATAGQGINASGSRHVRHQSSPVVARVGGFQPGMGQGLPSGHSMVLPHHPVGPWTQSPPRPGIDQGHYASYTIPETEREPSYGGPRYT